ncbi:MAG: GLPGLI family protein [Candidatus Symbiothrix sp.]|jgi:GLPGLI family protein|nr:GLPGLI family protein [Candidatus Symbiothrix sp.]
MNLRKWIIGISFIFAGHQMYAQYFNYNSHYEDLSKYNTIDSAYLKCSYRLIYLKDSLKPDNKSTDLQILLIGKTISKYYSQYALDYNHFVVNYLKTHDNYPHTTQKGAWTYELFKNYPQGKETVTDIASMLQGNFVYEEDLPVLDWKISNEKQEILSYNCQKATVSFRGRDFIAWFAPDIPVPNGPWKFGGLPGLILNLSDSENNFVYECQGLEQLENKEAIKYYKLEYTKINRKELNKLYKKFHDDFIAFQVSLGQSGVYVQDPKTKKFRLEEHSSYKIPYNPIELE